MWAFHSEPDGGVQSPAGVPETHDSTILDRPVSYVSENNRRGTRRSRIKTFVKTSTEGKGSAAACPPNRHRGHREGEPVCRQYADGRGATDVRAVQSQPRMCWCDARLSRMAGRAAAPTSTAVGARAFLEKEAQLGLGDRIEGLLWSLCLGPSPTHPESHWTGSQVDGTSVHQQRVCNVLLAKRVWGGWVHSLLLWPPQRITSPMLTSVRVAV
jgi:hypothetical protein